MEMQMEALTTKRNNPKIITLWTLRIAECKNSGISSQEWCEQNGIHIKTYYYWHNKIHKMVNKQQSCFYEIPVTSGNHERAAATIRVGLFQADIYSGADAETIKAICQAMKTC